MGAKNSVERNDNELLLGTKPKCYSSISDPGRNSGETIPTNQTFNTDSKRGRGYIKEEKPDGGWGWLVVFGVALSNVVGKLPFRISALGESHLKIYKAVGWKSVTWLYYMISSALTGTNAYPFMSFHMTTQSLISVFGLLFIEKLERLEITTKGASLMMGVQITTLNLSGLITGPVMSKFSYRKTAVAGALFVMVGLLLTTHADSLAEFVLSYSLFTGLGLGLLYPATFVAIDSYFSKKRGRAVGLSVAGTGIGQMLLPLLVEYLLDVYGFNGTLVILAGIASHSLLGATFYQPAKWHMKRRETRVFFPEEDKIDQAGDKRTGTDFPEGKRQEGVLAVNLGLMRSPSFLNLLVCLALVYTANMCFSMLLPFFLENIEYTLDDVALCMSVLSGADIVGRLILPVFTDVFHVRSKTIFFVGAALSAVARSGLMFPKGFVPTLLLAGACGAVRAALICNFNLSISEQTTPQKLPSALGLHMIFKGVAMMAFAPLIGFVRDYTKSYEFCMHVLSLFFLVLPFSAWLLEYTITKDNRPL